MSKEIKIIQTEFDKNRIFLMIYWKEKRRWILCQE